jgi:NAD(P)-dependent dehydrogenase (short-subunit alcohol dehydrogenase family)
MSVGDIAYRIAMAVADITPLVLVTGPTRGLGKDLVIALARRKVRLVLLGRDLAALTDVACLAKASGAPEAAAISLDLASFASIRRSVEEVDRGSASLGPINAVVANAGIQMSDRLHQTADGIETTFGVNVVGNQLLLSLLKPTLATDAHVVIVGSGTHFGDLMTRMVVAAPKWQEPEQLAKVSAADVGAHKAKAGQCAYSTSKLGVNYLVHELNRRWGSPLRANIYDPGLMPGTGLARDLPAFKQWAWNNVMPVLKVLPGVSSTANSAERLARLTLGEEHDGMSNAYIEIGKLSKASTESDNPARERALWDYCERITQEAKP